MSKGVLHVPVCINGGRTVPESLEDRELFINDLDEVFVGRGPNIKPRPIVSKEFNLIDIKKDVNGEKKVLAYIDPEKGTVIVGGLKISLDENNNYIIKKSDMDTSKIILSGIALNNIEMDNSHISNSDLFNVNRLVATKDMLYGEDPNIVEDPVNGQIFFRLMPNEWKF